MNEYGKLKTLSLLLVALCCIPLAASGQGTNIAYQDSQVRFTVHSGWSMHPTGSLLTIFRLWLSTGIIRQWIIS